MTTIRKIAKQRNTPKDPEKRNEKLTSAKHLAKLILNDPQVIPELKKRILDKLQWYITQIDGKFRTRFRSKKVVDLVDNAPDSMEKVVHEHVFTRKEVVDQLLEKPQDSDKILDRLVGCIVMKEEHEKLSKVTQCSGWARYKKAGIKVMDCSGARPKPCTPWVQDRS